MGNRNKNLFWYGFFASMKINFGSLLLFLGFFSLLIVILNRLFFVITLFLFIAGGILLAKGSSQRFDYQRRSGHIMHGGDGWRR